MLGPSPPAARKMLRVAATLLAAVFIGSTAAAIWNDADYASHKPRQPDPAAGRVNRIYVMHGTEIWVSQTELVRRNRVMRLFDMGLCCGLAAGTMSVRWKLFSTAR